MLRNLFIRDIVLIDRLEINLEPGLCTLTGETGAGKSILLDALGLALGGRGDSGLVAAKAKQGSVTAVFEAPADHPVWQILRDLDLPTDEDVVLRRVIGNDGRGRAYVNEHPVSIALLRRVGAELVEIHGQGAEVGLLDQATHRQLLDDYGGHQDLAAETAAAYAAWQAAVAEADAAAAEWEKVRQEEDYLRHALSELTELAAEPGEEQTLTQSRERLMSAEKIAEGLRRADEALTREGGVEDGVHQAIRAVDQVRRSAGESIDGVVAALERAGAEVAEALQAVATARYELEMDSGRLEGVEDRLFALRAAARKYECPVDRLSELTDLAQEKIAALEDDGRAVEARRAAAAAAEKKLRALATKLSRARRAAAKRLDKAVAKELAPLRLTKSTFKTEVSALEDDQVTKHGRDRVGFLVATNAGASLAPLAKVASGGERSRFMLALKVVLSQRGAAPTMIFDEVDSGIGGATADAVGERLAGLAADQQVLVVTHSPQVAARADHHWQVTKSGNRKTSTAVQILDDRGRGEEIARMLAGAEITDAARAAARSLLDRTHA